MHPHSIRRTYLGQRPRVAIPARSGGLVSTRPLKIQLSGGMARVSKRERDVVRLVSDGMRNQEIANKLNLSEHTVRNYLQRIYEKLGISSRVELVLYAASGGGLGD
jgi:DNA-binding CsgD family transcriptional regulator